MRVAGTGRFDGSIVLSQAAAFPTTITSGTNAFAPTFFTPSLLVAGHVQTFVHASAIDGTKRMRVDLSAQTTGTSVVLATVATTANITYSLPLPSPASATTEALIGATSTATLANKTFTAPVITDSGGTQSLILTVNNASPTRTLRFDVSNVATTTIKTTGDLTLGAAFTTTGGALTLTANASGSTLVLGSSGTLSFSYTSGGTVVFPAGGGTVVMTTGAQSITGQKTFTAPQILAGSTLDTDAAGTLGIGTVNATTITLGRSGQSVVLPGDLTVSGTTTSINTTDLNVTDKNITVNFGGSDASSEGAGLTVARTGTAGSLIYAAAAASRFKIGDLGSEAEVVTLSHTQTLTNKTLTSPVIATIVNTGTLTLPTSTDTLVGRATTDVLTNKDIDGGTASNTSRITLPKASTTTLNALTRKEGTVVYNTTLGAVQFDNGSTLSSLVTTASVQDSPVDASNYSITASSNGTALTIDLKDKAGNAPSAGSPVVIAFRNATSATGDYTVVSTTAALTPLVISSGSTLGHVANVPTYIYVYAINNAGTVELAVSSKLFDQDTVQTSTAEGGAGAADSATTLYSTTARTSKAIRLLARLSSTQTTAGTWAAVPTEISLGDTFVGAIPLSITNDTQATAMGLKQYLVGTAYAGGITPTISASTGTSAVTNTRSVLIPYQMSDGSWRLRFNIRVALTGSNTTDHGISLNGVTFKNVSNFLQPIAGYQDGSGTTGAYVNPGGGFFDQIGSSNTTTSWAASGDVELDSKPTWAY